MKIREAIEALTKELAQRGDVDVSVRMPSDFCEKHPSETGSCPYCDLCEHGKNRNQDCVECHKNDDTGWRRAQLNDRELSDLLRQFDTYPTRGTPFPIRNYHTREVALVPLLVAEVRQLRASQVKG